MVRIKLALFLLGTNEWIHCEVRKSPCFVMYQRSCSQIGKSISQFSYKKSNNNKKYKKEKKRKEKIEKEEEKKNTGMLSKNEQQLEEILEEQYRTTEIYCNSFIELYNCCVVVTSSSSSTSQQQQQQQQHEGEGNSMNHKSRTTSSIQKMMETIDQHQDAVRNLRNCMISLHNVLNELELELEEQQQQSLSGTTTTINILNNTNTTTTTRLIERKKQLLKNYIKKSDRIIHTIYQYGIRFHPNGIPILPIIHDTNVTTTTTMTFDKQFLIALATLRSSIQTLQKNLSI